MRRVRIELAVGEFAPVEPTASDPVVAPGVVPRPDAPSVSLGAVGLAFLGLAAVAAVVSTLDL